MLQVIKAEEVRDGEPRWWLADEDYRLDYMKPEHLHLYPRSCAETTHAIVYRPAPTPTPAPGLDLDAVERDFRSAMEGPPGNRSAIKFYHETWPALIAEVRALRAALTEAKRLGREAYGIAASAVQVIDDEGIDDDNESPRVKRDLGRIAAALEAL